MAECDSREHDRKVAECDNRECDRKVTACDSWEGGRVCDSREVTGRWQSVAAGK